MNQTPTITSANNTAFTYGTAGTFTVTGSGYPTTMTYSETGSLPGGVTLSTAGVLSGTPTAAGSYPITITASNGVTPNGTQSFTLTVNQASQTITVGTQAPSSAAYNGTFNVAATAGSSLGVGIAGSGGCSGTGSSGSATITMTSGTTACTVTFSQAENSNYSAATNVVETVNATKISPTVGWSTAPPTSEAYGGQFTVAATSNSTGTISYSVTGGCSNSGATVTMTSGTTACAVSASVTADNNYNVGSVGPTSVSATQATAVVTFTSSMTQSYTGFPAVVTVVTAPSGLGLSYSFTGITPTSYGPSTAPPTNPGSYAVAVSVVDSNYIGQNIGTLTISQLTPALSLELMTGMSEPSPYGTTVYFDLSMASTPLCPTGTVQFYVDGAVSGAPVVLSGASCTQPVAFQTATLTPGSHTVYAIYSGDTYYQGATSGTVTHGVADTTSVTLGTTGGSVQVGQPVTFTATITPVYASALVPAGTVEFFDGQNNQIGSGTLSATSPYTATYTTSTLALGPHSISATFVDTDGNFVGSSSTVASETVSQAVPTINWTPSPTEFTYGTPLVASTQLNAAAVDPFSGAPVGGSFSYTFAAGTVLQAGPVNVTATFTPTDTTDYAGNSATVSFLVDTAILTVTPDNLSMNYGGNVPNLTYEITGYVNNDLPTVVSGAASCTTAATSSSPVVTGGYSITCAQGTLGAANYTFQITVGTLTVNTVPLMITASSATASYGSTPAPIITASYSGFANGDSSTSLTTQPTCSTTYTPTSPAGTPVATTCTGAVDSNYSISYTAGSVTVNPASQASLTVVTTTPLTYNQSETLSTTGGTTGGTVTYNLVSGSCTLLGASLTATSGSGTCVVTATMAGNTNYNSVTSSQVSVNLGLAAQTINVTGVPLTSQAYGASFTVGASGYLGSAAGITFSAGGACSISGTTVTINAGSGLCSVTASIAGDNNYSSASSTATVGATQATALVTITPSTLTQTYSGSPKPVSVTTVPSPLSLTYSYTGISPTVYASSTIAPANPGSYQVVATVFDPNYMGQASGTLTINQLSPALSLALMTGMSEPSPYGSMVYFELSMATSTGSLPCPTGTVQFYVDGAASGSAVTLNGNSCANPVQFQTATLAPGSHNVYAVYSGDNYYSGSTSGTVTHGVQADTTGVTLAVSGTSENVGQPVTFTATVSPSSLDSSAQAPAGTVEFFDSASGSPVQIGTVTLSATSPYTAAFTTSLLAAGSHNISATYLSSDGEFTGSSSAVAVETTVNLIAPVIAWANPANIVYGTALSSTQLNATASDGNGNPVSGTFTYNPGVGAVPAVGQINLSVSFTPDDTSTYSSQTASPRST